MFDGRVLLKQVILLFWPLISTWVQGAEKIDSCQLQVLEMLSSLGSVGGKSAKPSFVSYVTPEVSYIFFN